MFPLSQDKGEHGDLLELQQNNLAFSIRWVFLAMLS